MNDIENLDVEETNISNPYSNNSYWKNSDKNQNENIEDFEYRKKYKQYLANNKAAKELCMISDYKINSFAFIITGILVELLSILTLVCSIFLIKDGNFKLASDFQFIGGIFGLLAIYPIIETKILLTKLPFRKTKSFKSLYKWLRHHHKELVLWVKTIRPPKKEEDWTFDDYFNEED